MKHKPSGDNRLFLNSRSAASLLGMSPRRLRELRPDLELGNHYLIASRKNAVRPTYVWNVIEIQNYLAQPLERR